MTSHDNPVLVLGATGTTGRRMVDELQRHGHPVRAASRNPAPVATDGDHGPVERVAFDWYDTATHDVVLSGVRALYLLAPADDPAVAELMPTFVGRAVEHGVQRLVLHSASSIERGGPGLGQAHQAMADSGVSWAAVRPTWFMQNLWNPGHPLGAAVRAGRDIVTATGDGRVPLVDAGDIARVAVYALTDPDVIDDDLVVTGPEALRYDDVAATLTRRLGRSVHHRAVAVDEATAAMVGAGIPTALAQVLAGMEQEIARGAEDRVTDTVERCTGSPARSLETVLTDDAPFTRDFS